MNKINNMAMSSMLLSDTTYLNFSNFNQNMGM